MRHTVTHSQGYTFRLTNPSDNPLVVAVGVTIGGTSVLGIYGAPNLAWSVINRGDVAGLTNGIDLTAGGTVTNGPPHATAATISGGGYGVTIGGGAGSVVNDGSIGASHAYTLVNAAGTRTGLAGTAIALTEGGTVRNRATGQGALVAGGKYGVDIDGGPGRVTNGGTIVANSTVVNDGYLGNYLSYRGGTAVALRDGGTVVNGSATSSTATIDGGSVGVAIAGGSGMVANDATIISHGSAYYASPNYYGSYSRGIGVSLALGGTVVNGSSTLGAALIDGGGVGVLISGAAGRVANRGAITAYGSEGNKYVYTTGNGIEMQRGGIVTNAASGLIAGGYYGVDIAGGRGTVLNSGTIEGEAGRFASKRGSGVRLQAGGSVVNGSPSAVITSDLDIGGGTGTVRNAGTVIGGVRVGGGAETVVNAGSVAFGVYVDAGSAGGTVVNSGVLDGGVQFLSGVYGVVVNSGTIGPNLLGGGFSMDFGTATGRLVVVPGAVFDLGVRSSGTGTNVIELARGASVGTLSGLGSTYTGFGRLQVDGGARWHLGGTNTAPGTLGIDARAESELTVTGTLAVGQALSVGGSGTLAVAPTGLIDVGSASTGATGRITVEAGATLAGAGVIIGPVVDRGLVEASGPRFVLEGAVGGAGTVAIDAGSVLRATQGLQAASVAFLAGGGERLELGTPGAVTSTLSGFAATDRIDLLGAVATAISYSSATHVLSVEGAGGGIAALRFAGSYGADAFRFASDHHGGTVLSLA